MVDVTIKDYQDWLKNNKQVKVPKEGETLSAFDEQENRALYAQYVNEANLLNQRKVQEKQLAEQKAAALRDNYVASEKAEKKAEDLAKMQGITTGASQSDLIDLYAKGAAARAGIIQANDNAKNDVFSAYSQALAESKASTNEAIAKIGALRAEKEKTETEANFEDYLQQYLDGVINKEALDSYYNDSEEYIRDSLKNAYNNIENQKADAELSAAITNYGNGVIGYDELMNAYERAGEHVDISVKDYIEGIQKQKDDADKITEFERALKQYQNGEIDFEELKQYEDVLSSYKGTDIYNAYKEEASNAEKAERVEAAITEFEKATGVDVKDGGKTLEELDADFFGYSETEFEALGKVIEDAKRRGDIKDGEYVNINLNGIPNINNIYTYHDGRFYKTSTFDRSKKEFDSEIKSLALYPDGTYSMLTSSKEKNILKDIGTVVGSWFK